MMKATSLPKLTLAVKCECAHKSGPKLLPGVGGLCYLVVTAVKGRKKSPPASSLLVWQAGNNSWKSFSAVSYCLFSSLTLVGYSLGNIVFQVPHWAVFCLDTHFQWLL